MTEDTTETVDTKVPTHTLYLISKEPGRYPAKIGVTFLTKSGNQRIVWDVIPSAVELQAGTLVLGEPPSRTEKDTA